MSGKTSKVMEASVPDASGRLSLSSIAHDALRARLRAGLVTPEDRLVDMEIATQLGMSRMPVREALLQLVAEGCLVSTARGYRIPTLNRDDVMEVFELRKLLEPRAAALAARDISREGIAQLGAALGEAKTAQATVDFSRLFRANADFRETWLGAVRNSRLAAVITRCADQVLTVRMSTLRDPAIQVIVVAGLQELHAAFARHDSVAAHDSMVRFVFAAERGYAALANASVE
ncbi:DNA-binding GntR family transcriptional regulator [Bradyrhizobium algeriense]|uniref:DNA-binding GntR family transcriptional regulator n=1 Tax=Bradyrhizobium algeriense TaxID=634784 RepID=A0ABU8BNU1_9BRAD